ncbi:MAG TPA: MarR family transcriptional regulator [Streptosporangiaceae bacterium]|nr:MarR family transcriptional regulator [Streptosporangiaceae bacterium]
MILDPEQVMLELQRATHAMLRVLAARLADENLPPSEINVLANLADGQFRSVGELAADAGVKPTTLTSILDRLGQRGYLARELDLGDRRSFVVHLTPEGAKAAQRASAAMADIVSEATGSLTEADVAGFRKVVRALTEAAR